MEIDIVIPASEDKKLIQAIENKINDLVDYIFTKSQENIVEMGVVDTAFMLQQSNVSRSGNTWKIIYSAPYAEAVHNGTSPHMPPVDSLKGWSRRKLGNESAAWAVAMKIKREGTDSKPYLSSALDEARHRFK